MFPLFILLLFMGKDLYINAYCTSWTHEHTKQNISPHKQLHDDEYEIPAKTDIPENCT